MSYIGLYLLTLQFYPSFITNYYALDNLSGALLLGLPLEEYIFAFSFGLMWSPIYEYANDIREK